MARKYAKISADAFSKFAVDSGLLLSSFDVTGEAAVTDDAIICCTTGNVTATCVPTYSDLGEDVNNCPNGMKEMMHLDSWECTLGFTALEISEKAIKTALGAADADESGKITPRKDVAGTDFKDYWLVVDLMGGGAAAVHLMNGLSTDGLSATFAKNTKAQIAITLRGHFSIDEQDVVPMEFYLLDTDET